MKGHQAANKRPLEEFGADGTRALDELLRRKLKVGNPTDVGEMLRALQSRYPERMAANTAESLGLPPTTNALAVVPSTPTQVAPRTVASAEYDTVMTQMKADFATVVDAPSERDIGVELSGWRDYLLK